MAFDGSTPADFSANNVEWPEDLICEGDNFCVEAGTADPQKKVPQVLMPPPFVTSQLSENQQSQIARGVVLPKTPPPLHMLGQSNLMV